MEDPVASQESDWDVFVRAGRARLAHVWKIFVYHELYFYSARLGARHLPPKPTDRVSDAARAACSQDCTDLIGDNVMNSFERSSF